MTTAAIPKDKALEPSFADALPHFLPITVFPLIVAAAMYGGWWLIGPMIFFMTVNPLDFALGTDERNMDPKKTSEKQVFWYNLPVWLWAFLWPATFVFVLWQIFMVGQLAVWESVLLILILATEAQSIFIVGHELIHRRSAWERYLGEFLLASASYPHYATEHFYIHHAYVGTPLDVGSAPKGQSFWHYFPRELASNLFGSWKMASNRMARRGLPAWHFRNPFWRYGIETALWYAFIIVAGGWWAVPVYMFLCLGIVFSMKISNYLQHYGLSRICLPNGRFERVRPRHSWSANFKFSKWMFFNFQRHPDHHVIASRNYPLLQHYGAEESPQLPGSYSTMFNLALRPKRWFATMDPLIDRWRERFYPDIKDWSAYESQVAKARPEAFSAIVEIFESAPRLAKAIERNPGLLDRLQDREFTDLEIPNGFGPDPEFETIARSGLVRVYWMHEFGVAEMKDQLSQYPVQDAVDAAEIVRIWSNDKVFQVGMHTLRCNLSPAEAGIALANIAEASIATILYSVVDDVADRIYHLDDGAVAVFALGELAARAVAPRTPLDLLFLHKDNLKDHKTDLFRRFREALGILANDSLLFEPLSTSREEIAEYALSDIANGNGTGGSTSELLNLARARCIFSTGDPDNVARFEAARRNILIRGSAREALVSELGEITENTFTEGISLMDSMNRGLMNIERAARFLQLTGLAEKQESPLPCDAIAVFREAKEHGEFAKDEAGRLVRATEKLRSLRGIHRLIMDDDASAEEASEKVRSILAQACGLADFSALTEAVRDSAAEAEKGWSTLTGRV